MNALGIGIIQLDLEPELYLFQTLRIECLLAGQLCNSRHALPESSRFVAVKLSWRKVLIQQSSTGTSTRLLAYLRA